MEKLLLENDIAKVDKLRKQEEVILKELQVKLALIVVENKYEREQELKKLQAGYLFLLEQNPAESLKIMKQELEKNYYAYGELLRKTQESLEEALNKKDPELELQSIKEGEKKQNVILNESARGFLNNEEQKVKEVEDYNKEELERELEILMKEYEEVLKSYSSSLERYSNLEKVLASKANKYEGAKDKAFAF